MKEEKIELIKKIGKLKENRDNTIGVRVTQSERNSIEDFLKNYNMENKTDLTLTEFVRTAIFTHLHNLQNAEHIIDITSLLNFKNKVNDLNDLINRIIIEVSEQIELSRKEKNYEISKVYTED